LVCQRCSSKAVKSRGIIPSTASGLSDAIMAAPAFSAAICTGRCLSADSAMIHGKRVTRYGSTQKTPTDFAHLARSSVAAMAASLVSFASAALAIAVTTDLAEVLSVCSRSVFDASHHARSSGSLEAMVESVEGAEWLL